MARSERPLDPTFDKRLGAAVRDLREQAKLTQEDMASTIGVSDKAISKRERGDMPISANELVALTRRIGVHPEDALRLAGVTEPPWTTEETIRTDPRLTPLRRQVLLSQLEAALLASDDS